MHRIGQDEIKPLLQGVPDGFPVNPGGFHNRMGAACLQKPSSELEKPPRGCLECFDLRGNGLVLFDSPAGNNVVAVDIEARASGMEQLHGIPPFKKVRRGRAHLFGI